MERRRGNERLEVPMTVSVAGLVSFVDGINGDVLLLVKKRESGKWGLPAGGILFSQQEGRPETPTEALRREMIEEAGFDYQDNPYRPKLRGVINIPHPTKDKHSLGVIYQINCGSSKPCLKTTF